jgi:hypothetical protein
MFLLFIIMWTFVLFVYVVCIFRLIYQFLLLLPDIHQLGFVGLHRLLLAILYLSTIPHFVHHNKLIVHLSPVLLGLVMIVKYLSSNNILLGSSWIISLRVLKQQENIFLSISKRLILNENQAGTELSLNSLPYLCFIHEGRFSYWPTFHLFCMHTKTTFYSLHLKNSALFYSYELES